MAAQAATAKVGGMLGDDEHSFGKDLERMGEEAAETERRCTDAAGEFDGKKTVILDQARETKHEASEMMKTHLEGETDALDGFEFLTRPRPARSGTGRS